MCFGKEAIPWILLAAVIAYVLICSFKGIKEGPFVSIFILLLLIMLAVTVKRDFFELLGILFVFVALIVMWFRFRP